MDRTRVDDKMQPGKPHEDTPATYAAGFANGYRMGWDDATDKYDGDLDESSLTFSHADLAVLGTGLLAVLAPLAILLTRAGRR